MGAAAVRTRTGLARRAVAFLRSGRLDQSRDMTFRIGAGDCAGSGFLGPTTGVRRSLVATGLATPMLTSVAMAGPATKQMRGSDKGARRVRKQKRRQADPGNQT